MYTCTHPTLVLRWYWTPW